MRGAAVGATRARAANEHATVEATAQSDKRRAPGRSRPGAIDSAIWHEDIWWRHYVPRVIERTEHDDVTAYRLSSWGSRLAGYRVHVFRVRDVLIDTGFPAAQRELASLLEPEPIRGAIVTHQHEDHAGNVAWLAARGVPMRMSEATHRALRQPTRIGLYRHVTWRAMQPLQNDLIPLHDPSLSLVHAPGHSPDHHVVWDHDTNTVFAGDLFLGVRVRVAHVYESPAQQLRALRDVIARQPSRVFCAHRGLLPDGVDLLAAKAAWLELLIAQVHALSETGLGVDAIRAQLLGPRGRTHWISAGDYSPDHIVRAILRDR